MMRISFVILLSLRLPSKLYWHATDEFYTLPETDASHEDEWTTAADKLYPSVITL